MAHAHKRIHAKNDFLIIDGIVFMTLTRGQWATFDEIDLPVVAKYRWHAKANKDASTFYASTWLQPDEDGHRTHLTMHRVIMGVTDNKLFVDHMNGRTLNNQRSNLRICGPRQNVTNSASFVAKFGYKGISKGAASKSFVARLMHDGHEYSKGKIPTAIEAAGEYDRLAVKYRGLDGLQPRSLNFPSTFAYLMWDIHGIDVSGSFGRKAA